MKQIVVCILQNAWGDRELPLLFIPNEENHSCKRLRKMVTGRLLFGNTTHVVTRSAKEKAETNEKHFLKVIREIDSLKEHLKCILVCGNQAQKIFIKHLEKFQEINTPYFFIRHPAARNWRKEDFEETYKMIEEGVKEFQKEKLIA